MTVPHIHATLPKSWAKAFTRITPEPSLRSSKLTAVFHLTNSNFVHGVSLLGSSNTAYEASQVFYAPFVGQTVFNEPRGIGTKKTVVTEGTGVNQVARNAFYLRSTREAGNAIRPLVDANIRAMWNNPRWDAPLGLTMLASHSETSNTAPSANLPMMATSANGDGFTYMGSDRDPSGYDRVVLFDVPRSDLVSLGQLQHAAAGRFSYEPTYIVGNSYANLRIPLDSVVGSVSDTAFCAPRDLPAIGNFNLYDASYIVNERLWDEYIFTTIPQSGSGPSLPPPIASRCSPAMSFFPTPASFPTNPAAPRFPSARYRMPGQATVSPAQAPFSITRATSSWTVPSTSTRHPSMRGRRSFPRRTACPSASSTDGSVDGFTEVENVSFPRAASHLGTGMKTSGMDENYWIGFRELTQPEVRELATEIVAQIRERGPFLTLGSFVNRKLEIARKGNPVRSRQPSTIP